MIRVTGKRLKAIREGREESIAHACEEMRIEPRTLIDYEESAVMPSIERLMMLAKYYRVTVDYLLGMSDIRVIYTNDFVREADLTHEEIAAILRCMTARQGSREDLRGLILNSERIAARMRHLGHLLDDTRELIGKITGE